MRLRPRLALATVAVSLPVVLGLVAWDARSRREAAEEELAAFARHLAASPDWLARCAADPVGWSRGPQGGPPGPPGPPPDRGPPPDHGPPPGPPPDRGPPGPHNGRRPPHSRPALFFAYNDHFAPARPDGLAIPAATQAALREHDEAGLPMPFGSDRVRVLLRGSEGACAYVLAEGTMEPWLGGILPRTHLWLLPLVTVAAAVLLAVGPVIRRVRRLQAQVRRSAASGYASRVSVEGGDEIAELAQAFDEAAQRAHSLLEETNRREQALRDFLANTTHDIMIPLTVLQGHLAALQPRVADATDAATLRSAMDEAHYLGALIHNLGIAARLDASATMLTRSPVDLAALVERVVSRHRPIARSLLVSLDRAVPTPAPHAEGDVTLIEQAVSNLVYNATRYNRPGGHVAVILEARDGRFSLRVLDDGPGIPEDQLARLVERGFRGNEARTRAPDGHGLGLHITHRVAELHGFSLAFRPSEYGGLEVELAGSTHAPSLT